MKTWLNWVAIGLCIALNVTSFFWLWKAWEARDRAYLLHNTGVSCLRA
jgi:hypothetical protein